MNGRKRGIHVEKGSLSSEKKPMKYCLDILNQKPKLIDRIVKESGENNDTAIQLWLQLKRGSQRRMVATPVRGTS